MIAFRNFALRRGERLLLSQVDLALHAGWRVGVIGRNGCGKSSLFAAILGEVEADQGDIDLPGKVRIAWVAQETPSLPDPAIDFVLSGDTEVHAILQAEAAATAAEDWDAVAEAHQKLAEINGYDATARAGRLLHGLGFPPETHDRPVSSFSGGWRVRLNLARALMMPSDLLLLDEPTNHLDLDAVLWLEQWLLKYPGTLLMISHDREFLDGLSTHTLHLHEGRAKLYTGDYTSFERQRAEHLRQQQIAHDKEQAERAHLQSFIDRFKAKASKARQAQSRMKRLAKLQGTEAVRAERAFRIAFAEPARLPHSLIRLNHVDAGYRLGAATGEVATILHDVGFGLEAGDRVGLLGPNGAGKSTLVKTLVGELPLLSGERVAHPDLRIGYFAQHTVESLHEGQSPLWHLKQLAPDAGEQQLRNYLGRWNFVGDRAFENVDGFSGGERARLALAMIAYREPNVLLLDEPTNHLDLDMREALAEALADFPGAIVLVSHDRHLIGLVCETFWRVADGHVEEFNGDLDEYAAWLRSRGNEPKAPKAAAAKPAPAPAPAPAKPARGRHEVDQAARKARQLEQRVAELAAELARVEAKLADPAVYGNDGGIELGQLTRQQEKLAAEKDALEAEWLAQLEIAEG
ncbi:ABC-F family ATP-binding cassette domain-containing protein [Arenimonas caeni]|jgi:ATP-binding cassette subfamily F protein 3|uniref:ABC-F family ATP-binding cassette domain-containing protein n=1 Tax=Arenimonas caeni TaxID=2058085 RepID=UPI002A35AD98|nr:ATP-binding cassette domain-containing protein [Arenimonas caeni]MDY0021556.1 ATP-binding cassette domain-containing protein [Arenimonas caeni]